ADRLNVHLQSLLDECLQYLIDANIIRVKEVEQISDDSHVEKVKRLLYETTKLGKATVEGSVDLGLATSV
ncbi:unnamed protein product, partial [Rotaria magnacalcarata]